MVLLKEFVLSLNNKTIQVKKIQNTLWIHMFITSSISTESEINDINVCVSS